jgi:hypothetical protein
MVPVLYERNKANVFFKNLVKEMKASMKALICRVAKENEFSVINEKSFFPLQLKKIYLQLEWTKKVEEAIKENTLQKLLESQNDFVK